MQAVRTVSDCVVERPHVEVCTGRVGMQFTTLGVDIQ